MGYLLWASAGLVTAAGRQSQLGPGGVAPLTVAGLAARRNRFMMVVLTLLLAPVVAVVWLSHGLWLSVLFGPRNATTAEIVAARTDGDDHQWFRLTDQPRYLNVTRLLTNQTPQGPVRVLFLLYVLPGSPSLLLEAEHGAVQPPASASTEPADLPPPIYAWISVRDPFDESYLRAREAAARLGYASLATFMLSRSDLSPAFTRMVTAIAAAPVAVAVLLLLRGLVVAVRGLRDPLRTPGVRDLQQSCRAGEGLGHLIREIDAEAARAQLPLKSRGSLWSPSWSMLSSWLIVRFGIPFRLLSTEDIIWIAPFTVTSYMWGVLRVGVQSEIRVVDRCGRWTVIPVLPTADLNAAVRQVHSRAPWAVAGVSPEMTRAFGTGPKTPWWWMTRRSRPELVRRVDERRLAIAARAKSGGTA